MVEKAARGQPNGHPFSHRDTPGAPRCPRAAPGIPPGCFFNDFGMDSCTCGCPGAAVFMIWRIDFYTLGCCPGCFFKQIAVVVPSTDDSNIQALSQCPDNHPDRRHRPQGLYNISDTYPSSHILVHISLFTYPSSHIVVHIS